MAHTFVKDIMIKELFTIDSSKTIRDAATLMFDKGVGCVIITKNSKPCGILTERDFITKIASKGIPYTTSISEVMSTPLIVTKPADTVWEASQLMKTKNIHKLPVKEGDNLIGIITATDIIKICSLGSDSEMRKICDQILLRIKETPYNPN